MSRRNRRAGSRRDQDRRCLKCTAFLRTIDRLLCRRCQDAQDRQLTATEHR